jgi:tellurite resistance protein
MANRNVAILKAVVCVAWADGLLKDPERKALEGVFAAGDLTPDEVAELRAYAARPHTLADLDTSSLALEDRRTVVMHAVALAYADNEYSIPERQVIVGLCQKLGLSDAEAHSMLVAANARVQR